MGYLIFRRVSTSTDATISASICDSKLSNVYVSKMPSPKKAMQRVTEYYVKGRDGALHVNEGYGNFDLSVTLVMLKAPATTRRIVNAWADGTGLLISSDDLTKAYRASVNDEVEWTRVEANGGFYDSARITFNCQPYMYESVETVIEKTATGTILNLTGSTALPLIAVEGSGDSTFTLGGQEITIADMTAGTPVFIDCENGYVYTESAATTMTGDFPEIPTGESDVIFGSGVTKLTITPHWRWL